MSPPFLMTRGRPLSERQIENRRFWQVRIWPRSTPRRSDWQAPAKFKLSGTKLVAFVMALSLVGLVVWTGARTFGVSRREAAEARASAPIGTGQSNKNKADSIKKSIPIPPPHIPGARSTSKTTPPSLNGASRAERNEFTLESYLEWAKYPPGSRPIAERPDRLKPHFIGPRSLPLAKDGAVRAVLWQSHVYLAGREKALLRIVCKRGESPVPCSIDSATLSAEAERGGAEAVKVPFSTDLSAVVAPFELGFETYSGPLMVRVLLEGSEVTFALLYTAAAPATFTGVVRETVEEGSLHICVGLNVQKAGRYVLDGRIDDDSGQTFAFVNFNEELPEGIGEACFQVFGKLIVDESRGGPFVLRDVEGFLLEENTFPDRLTLATWEGMVYRTRAYSLDDFSSNEYESEAKRQKVIVLSGGKADQ